MSAQEVINVRHRLHAVALEDGIRTEAGSFRKLGRKSLGKVGDRALELRKKGMMELRPKSMMCH